MSKRRICIIGNSHIAAIKTGLDLLPKLHDDYEFDFFAAHGDDLRSMGLAGSKLIPTSEVTKRRMALLFAGEVEIEIPNYEYFILVGLGFDLISAFIALRKYSVYGFHENDGVASPFISRACYAATMDAILRDSTAVKLAGLLRVATANRIAVIPSPLPSELIVNDEQGYWRKVVENGLLSYAGELFENSAMRVARDRGVEYIPQPPSTRASSPLTLEKFSRNTIALSPAMNVVRAPSDRYHMNSMFGVEFLNKYVELIT